MNIILTLFLSESWSSKSLIWFLNCFSKSSLSLCFIYSSSSWVILFDNSLNSASCRLFSSFTNSICWDISAFLTSAAFFSEVTLERIIIFSENVYNSLFHIPWKSFLNIERINFLFLKILLQSGYLIFERHINLLSFFNWHH